MDDKGDFVFTGDHQTIAVKMRDEVQFLNVDGALVSRYPLKRVSEDTTYRLLASTKETFLLSLPYYYSPPHHAKLLRLTDMSLVQDFDLKDPVLAATTAPHEAQKESLSPWEGFQSGLWQKEVNVRDFIQQNYEPYEGDAYFLSPATRRTQRLWEGLNKLFLEERRKGVLDISQIPSSITAHATGYIDRENEIIVGLQTDAPLKRAINPNGGLRCSVGYPSLSRGRNGRSNRPRRLARMLRTPRKTRLCLRRNSW